jgi:putative ABC transport system permease protein
VVGADVAQALHYRSGDTITISHGTGAASFLQHDDHPLRIAGVLARTGTPVDRAVHVSLEAIATIHAEGASQQPAPDSITAFLVGMRSKAMTLTMQRAINTYRAEPLTAIVPGVTLGTLWKLVGTADRALTIISGFVVVAGLLGMMASILAGLNERRREMAILRAIGWPHHVFGLLVAEAGLLVGAGVCLAPCWAWVCWRRRQSSLRGSGSRSPSVPGITGTLDTGGDRHGGLGGLVPAARAYSTRWAMGSSSRPEP